MAMLQNTTNQQETKGLTIPAIWLKVRGSLKVKRVSGLSYQKKVRQEWEDRLLKLYRKHAA